MKSRFGASLEPFTEIHVTYFEKEGRELVSISSCDILQSHFHRASRTENAAALSYITELLCEFLPVHDPNERLYRLVMALMEAMDADLDLESLLRYFEVWLLKLSGYFPDLRTCSGCNGHIDGGVWLANDGTPQCYNCSGGRGTAISVDLRCTIELLLRNSPEAFARIEKPAGHVTAIGEVCYRLIRRFLERDLRSYELMNQVQAEMRRVN